MDNNMVLNTGFNELVFENRHKGYGAYQLRRRYKRNVILAGLISISIFSSGMVLYFTNLPNAMAAEAPKDNGGVVVIPFDGTIHPPVVPPKPIVHPAFTAPKGPDNPQFTTPKVTSQPVETKSIDSSGTSSRGIVGGTGTQVDTTKNGCTNCVAKQDSIPPAPKRVDWTNDPIKDPGLDAYFRKYIRYPEFAKEQGIEGTEYLEFVVDINGNPKDFKIVKSSNPMFAKEVLRVAPGMPKFDPITFQGEPVEFVMHKPIHFLLGK